MKVGRLRQLRRQVWNFIRSLFPLTKLTSPARHLSASYLRGNGIEIGALADPLRLPPGARVAYVDRYSTDDLRKNYPTLKSAALVHVDIVCDGETLTGVADESQDFVIARHFLEHCQDPIGTLEQFFRVIKPGGIVYISVPDKRYTFDRTRAVTPLIHLLEDHQWGPDRSRRAHFEDYVRAVNHPQNQEEVELIADELIAVDYSIHYHVWTQHEVLELMLTLRPRIGFDIESFCKNRRENICVLRKNTDKTPDVEHPQNRALRWDRYSTSARSNGMLVSSGT